MRDPAWEIDAVGDSLFLQGGFDRLIQLPVTTDEHMVVLLVAKDCGKRPDKILDAFLLAQPADIADPARPVRHGNGSGECFKIEEVLVRDENFVAVEFELPVGNKYRRI